MMSTIFSSGSRKAWYLDHSAWLIETGTQRLLFDYGRLPHRASTGGLENGVFDPAAFGDQPLTVFFSHQHGDHYHPDLHRQLGMAGKASVIVGLDVGQHVSGMMMEHTSIMRPRDRLQKNELLILASGSTDSGVSFLVVAPDFVCYHGGDLAAWDDTAWFREAYRQEIDWLGDRLSETGRTLDVAMLPVSTSDGYQEEVLLEGVDYALEKLRPRQVLPMHGFGFESLYMDFAVRESRKAVPTLVHLPVQVCGADGEAGIVVKDRNKGVAKKAAEGILLI